MGCDIHVYVETKVYDVFWSVAQVSLSRDYRMFSLMAGVRGNEALVAPRGIPEDSCTIVKWNFKEWGTDAHTPSWLTTEEFAAVISTYKAGNNGQCPNPIYVATLKMMRVLGDSARIVFWFDN